MHCDHTLLLNFYTLITMQERQLTEAESLAIITQMIQNTHRRLTINAGKPYLIWGYLTCIVAFFEYLVVVNEWSLYWLFGWWLIPVVGFPLMLLTCRRKPTEPKNYIDRAVSSVWIACSLAMIPAFAIALFHRVSILPLITLIISIGTLISGRLIAMKPVVWGGILFLVGTLAMAIQQLWIQKGAMSGAPNEYTLFLYKAEILIFAVLFLVGMVIPGHIINAKTRKNA